MSKSCSPDGTDIDGLRVGHALLSQPDRGEMQFSADLVVDGRTVTIEGSASQDAASKRIAGLKLATTVSPPAKPDGTPAETDAAAARGQAGCSRHAGSVCNQPQRQRRWR